MAAPGFVHKGKNGAELLFLSDMFRELVCAGLDERAAIAALKAAGLLVVQKGGKSSVVRDLPQPLGRMRVIAVKAEIERFASDSVQGRRQLAKGTKELHIGRAST